MYSCKKDKLCSCFLCRRSGRNLEIRPLKPVLYGALQCCVGECPNNSFSVQLAPVQHIRVIFVRQVRRSPPAGMTAFFDNAELEISSNQCQNTVVSTLQRIEGFGRRNEQHRDLRACENSSNQQCPGCNTYWEIGIAFVGRNFKSSKRPKEFEKNNYDGHLNP